MNAIVSPQAGETDAGLTLSSEFAGSSAAIAEPGVDDCSI